MKSYGQKKLSQSDDLDSRPLRRGAWLQDVMGDAAAWVSVRVLGGSVPILQPQFLFPPPLSLDLALAQRHVYAGVHLS